MKKTIPLLFILAIGCLQAEPRYITDQTHITMRSGEGTSHKIQRMLPAGEKVELVSSSKKTGYSKVRDGKGQIGYILTRQLMKSPSARDRVAVAEKKYAEMKLRMGTVVKPHEELQQKHQKLITEYNKLRASKGSLDTELKEIREVSSDSIRIAKERKELRKQLAAQTWELENLKQENQEFKNDQSQYWFMVGAGVIILGIIIGMLLPHFHTSSKKQTW